MSNKKSGRGLRLVKNVLLLFTGNFVTRILSFFMVPFYTSILSTADYGTADLITTTVLLVLPIFSMLMDEAVLRFALDSSSDKKQVFSTAMALSTLGFFAAMCFSPIVLFFDGLRPYYWFVVLYYISSWLYNICSFYVRGIDKVAITTVAGVVQTFAYLLINIICLAVLKWGIYGYLSAICFSNIIAAAVLFIACKLYKNLISIKKLNRNFAKEMLKYSLPMIPDYISWWFNNCLDRYMLAFFCGSSEVGLYSVAHKIPGVLNSLTSIFSSAWRISSVENFGSKESIDFYNKIYRLYSGFLVMGAAGITLFSKVLAKILFSNDFFQAWKITPILVLSYVFSALAIFVGSIFTASKKTGKLFLAPLIGGTVNFILNLILIPMFKGTGAAIATTIGYLAIFIFQMINTKKILKMNFNLKCLIPTFVLLCFEIFLVSIDSFYTILFAVACAVIIFIINGKNFLFFVNLLLNKMRHKKIDTQEEKLSNEV